MFKTKQTLFCIISQLLSPWAPFCILFCTSILLCMLWLLHMFLFCLLALAFSFCANGLCCFNFLCALFLVLQVLCTSSTFLYIIMVPLVLLGSAWLLFSCTIWLPSIAWVLCYFVWLLHYLIQLAKYQFDFQLLLALINTFTAQLLLALFDSPCVGGASPSSFCVGVSWGFKLGASKSKLV